jgi:hypothetical protein
MSRDQRTGGPTPAPINEAAMAGYGAPCRPVTSERRTGSHPLLPLPPRHRMDAVDPKPTFACGCFRCSSAELGLVAIY